MDSSHDIIIDSEFPDADLLSAKITNKQFSSITIPSKTNPLQSLNSIKDENDFNSKRKNVSEPIE